MKVDTAFEKLESFIAFPNISVKYLYYTATLIGISECQHQTKCSSPPERSGISSRKGYTSQKYTLTAIEHKITICLQQTTNSAATDHQISICFCNSQPIYALILAHGENRGTRKFD